MQSRRCVFWKWIIRHHMFGLLSYWRREDDPDNYTPPKYQTVAQCDDHGMGVYWMRTIHSQKSPVLWEYHMSSFKPTQILLRRCQRTNVYKVRIHVRQRLYNELDVLLFSQVELPPDNNVLESVYSADRPKSVWIPLSKYSMSCA